MKQNLEFIFGVGVYSEQLDIDLNELESVCLDKMNTLESVTRSNAGGWHSPMLDEDSYFVNSSLSSRIKEGVNRTSSVLGLTNLELRDLWININGKYHSNHIHTHPGTSISGVFYVRAPKNSGSIVFYHPASGLLDRDWGDVRTNFNHNNSEKLMVTPRENLLLLFPSWIYHSVDQNLSDENRISISFNFN